MNAMITALMLSTIICFTSPESKINNTIENFSCNEVNVNVENENCNVLRSNTIEYSTGYVKVDSLNVRKEPNTDSKILDILRYNEKIKYLDYGKEWVKVKYKKKFAYVNKKYISKKKMKYVDYSVPSYEGFKSWMDYRKIKMNGSEQKILQDDYAYTGRYGIRQVNNRYCVAVGSYFTTDVGRYFDLILENNEVIPCILADRKDDGDTDVDNIFTKKNGCATEFVIDEDSLNRPAREDGNISACTDKWNSPVKTIRIYSKNIFNEENN